MQRIVVGNRLMNKLQRLGLTLSMYIVGELYELIEDRLGDHLIY